MPTTFSFDEATQEPKAFSFEEASQPPSSAPPEVSDTAPYGGRGSQPPVAHDQPYTESRVTGPGFTFEDAVRPLATAARAVSQFVDEKASNAYNVAARITGHKPIQPDQSLLPDSVLDFAKQVGSDVAKQFGASDEAASGLGTSVQKAVAGTTTAGGIATLPLFGIKAGRAAILGMMAASTPSQIANTYHVLNDPDATTAQKWEALGDSGIQLAMTAGLALGMRPEEVRAKLTPDEAAKQSENLTPKTEQALAETINTKAPNERTKDQLETTGQSPEQQTQGGAAGQGQERQPNNDVQKESQSGADGLLTPETDKAVKEAGINPGGAQEDLPPEQKAISEANNSRAAWGDFGGLNKPAEEVVDQPVKEPEQPKEGVEALKSEKLVKVTPPEGASFIKITTKDGKSAVESIAKFKKFNPFQGVDIDKVEAGTKDSKGKFVPMAEEPKIIGMGGATPEEIPPTGPREGEGTPTYGISAESLEQRRQRGVIAPIETGEGISAEDSVNKGRELLSQGANPEKIMSDFEQTKRLSSEDIAVARAHGEQLERYAYAAADEFGVNSPQYEAAWEADSAWSKRLKAMSTEWHKTGMAQQGETEIDTGTFHGLRKIHEEASGRDFTPQEAGAAQGQADRVKKANENAAQAEGKLFHELARKASGMTDAEKAALAAASKTVRDAAARTAEAENKYNIAEQARKTAVDKLEQDAAKNALKAASKTVRDAAADLAERQNKKAVADAERAKKVAQEELNAAKKAQAAVDKVHRDAAAKAAELARKQQDDPVWHVWQQVKGYIEKGEDGFDDIRNKVATDLGMKVEQVTRLINQPARAKVLADDLWRKQQTARLIRAQAKRWVANLSTPGYIKALQSVPNFAFGAKVFGHGTVAMATHAPMVAFQPNYWGAYLTDFGKMYKMVFSKSFYENQVQDLLRRPNYTTARRAGLVNDPSAYEEYDNPQLLEKVSPKVAEWVGKATGMGSRGYSVLKILRQDMFDQQWDKLPRTAKIPEVAQAIADGVNHATGVVKGKAPRGSNVVLFAPRLEASRVAWLAVDPIKAANTFMDWKNADPGQKQFAINQIKEKAWVAGTLVSLLTLNQGMLSVTGSNQKVNLTDPMKSDFMKFKVAGMTLSYGNAMTTMARLPVRLYAIRESNGGKLKNLVYADEDTYTVLGEYARSQLSPFASLATDLWLKSDWMNRQLPNSQRPEPARLRKQGIKPYTWKEFLTEQTLPIPAEEAVREVWKDGLGMSDEQIKNMRKAVATIAVMSATGARLTDDRDAKK